MSLFYDNKLNSTATSNLEAYVTHEFIMKNYIFIVAGSLLLLACDKPTATSIENKTVTEKEVAFR